MSIVTIASLFELSINLENTASLLMEPYRNHESLNRWVGITAHYAEYFAPLLGVDIAEFRSDWDALDDALMVNPADQKIITLHPKVQQHVTRMRCRLKEIIADISDRVGDVDAA